MRIRQPAGMLLLLMALTLSAMADAGAGDYAVVINAANPYQEEAQDMKQVVRQLFLKQRTEWPSSSMTVRPFARTSDSPEHRAFLSKVLQMSEAELADHWISLKQRTGQAAPREISRDKLLLRLVSRYEGGLAVVRQESVEAAGPEVKVLFTFSD